MTAWRGRISLFQGKVTQLDTQYQVMSLIQTHIGTKLNRLIRLYLSVNMDELVCVCVCAKIKEK